MIDISQIEQRLGSFSDNLIKYCKKFLHLTWAHALTRGEIYNIINGTITEDQKERTWKAEEQHVTNSTNNTPKDTSPATKAILRTEPQWSYQDGTQDQSPGITRSPAY
jgi:hypothetical protein